MPPRPVARRESKRPNPTVRRRGRVAPLGVCGEQWQAVLTDDPDHAQELDG